MRREKIRSGVGVSEKGEEWRTRRKEKWRR